MASPAPLCLKTLRRFLTVLIALVLALFVYQADRMMTTLQGGGSRPFGVFPGANGDLIVQDFSYNLLYFQGVRDRLVSHPYRLEDQEKLARHMVPGSISGLSHGYSPVAFILALPLLDLSGHAAYVAYLILGATGILLLFHFHLAPKAESPPQLLAVAGCIISVWLASIFAVGQSSLITTPLLGAFWALLQRRREDSPVWMDGLLALLFWALCLKPNVAFIPFTLLLGNRAWRALAIGMALLLLSWILVAPYYGGWWTGLRDYLALLNHYNNQELTPFLHRGQPVPAGQEPHGLFASIPWFVICRDLFLVLSLLLLLVRWTGRVTPSEQFQGMAWVFLLFCPYLMPTENWVLCLLVVEGTFFQARHPALDYLKLLLLLGIMDLRAGLTFPVDINAYLKCALFLWVAVEWLRARKNLKIPRLRPG